MNSRVRLLREVSLAAVPEISSERAVLLTEFYSENDSDDFPVPLQRAMAFMYLMENRTIFIGSNELIVGEKGPGPKAVPTYPELCCHTVPDLNLLDSREKTPFRVSEEVIEVYRDKIIPFWKYRTMRLSIFDSMEPSWLDAYNAGVFTEFMEQRSPGHTVLDGKIYESGFLDFISRAEIRLEKENNPKKQAELKAMIITMRALIRFAERHSEKAVYLSSVVTDPERSLELLDIASVCSRVPAHAPGTFREALQYYWFVHLGVTTELNPWDAFSPGKLDQHLYPFYRKEVDSGKLTKEDAEELLQCFWIKFNNQPAPPKVGVTAAESSTYTDFAQINLGGVKPDGSDGVNELTYLMLDVIEEMRLLQPSSSVQVSQNNPDEYILRAAKIIRTGFGQPSVFNSEMIIKELLRQGKTLEDARCGGTSGCVETGAFGKENYCLTGYFNLTKILELVLNNGYDQRSDTQLGPRTGDPMDFDSFDDFFEAFKLQLKYFTDVKIEGNRRIEKLYAEKLPVPFLSVLIDDCIEKGIDYHCGGARYDTSYIQGVGLGTVTDSLSAVKTHVFEKKTLSMKQLITVLKRNFSSEGDERIRQLFLNRTPRYGNDDDSADEIMVEVFNSFFETVDGIKNTRGGEYRINMLPTTCHVYFGSVIGATPDGRHAGKPLSEGISPVQGSDRQGPTAVLLSAAKMDHSLTGGTLLNQRFTPQLLSNSSGLQKLVHLIRGYFKLGGHHIQFNVVDSDTLEKARLAPDEYRDLIVRVAGYSDYFCDLSPELQEEILSRTAHKGI